MIELYVGLRFCTVLCRQIVLCLRIALLLLVEKDLAEYDRLSLIALADKFKLSGKDLFSAIQREHEQLEKLRGEGMTDEDISSLTDNAPAESVADAPKYGSFPRSFTSEGALNE